MTHNKMLPKWLRDWLDAIIISGKKCRPIVRTHKKIGRNEPCPCGSQKKYKHCHYNVDYLKGNV